MTKNNLTSLNSKRDFARRVKKSERWVNTQMAARNIEYIKVGGTVRFTDEAIERFLKSHTVHAA